MKKFNNLPYYFLNLICYTALCFLFATNAFSQNIIKYELHKNWLFRKAGDLKYYYAYIPGTIHTDLYKNQIIPEPFYGNNEAKLQWIENENWEYRLIFSVSDTILNANHIQLIFEGLDTYATVKLNDSLILVADNMFRSWNVNIKPLLKKEKNELFIVFESAVKKGKKAAALLNYTLPGGERVFTRKAQYQYGWDWAPRFVSSGIWKKVYIEAWNHIKIEEVQIIQQSVQKDTARLTAAFTVNSDKNAAFFLYVKDKNTNFTYTDKKIKLVKGINKINLDFKILNPKLWWTKGMGEAHLYRLECGIRDANVIADNRIINTGLRTIEIVRENDSIGESFYFKLNGFPLFIKGANYIPADVFTTRVDSIKYARIINDAVNANMNMLRVWGGGIYESDMFYELCDKNGILVWQDFMFACAMYPGDSLFIENISYEITETIKRLRNHPSIALWCGNNEIDEGWHNWGWQKDYKYSATDSASIWNDYLKIFHVIIPGLIKKYDENRYYHPSSPSAGWGRKESLLRGDCHYWGVWWGMEPFDMYKLKTGRFMSEYGFQAMPPYSALRKIATADSLYLYSSYISNHQKHPAGYKTIHSYMERDYKIPLHFKDYIYVSQLLQAEGIKTAIEAHRSAKPYCMGTLYWQLNDCWQVTSWSSLDYYNNRKALYYYVKKYYDDILISFIVNNDSVKVNIMNDCQNKTNGTLSIKLIKFDGSLVFQQQFPVTLAKNSNQTYYSFSKGILQHLNIKTLCLECKYIDTATKKSYQQILCFVKPKELELTLPDIRIKQLTDFSFEISADVFAKNVYIYSEDKELKLNDNYFDLMPGEIKTIISEEKINTGLLKIKTLADCYP